jgi:hypothetical protein
MPLLSADLSSRRYISMRNALLCYIHESFARVISIEANRGSLPALLLPLRSGSVLSWAGAIRNLITLHRYARDYLMPFIWLALLLYSRRLREMH